MDQPATKSVDIIKLLSKAHCKYNQMMEDPNYPESKSMTDTPDESSACSSQIHPTPYHLPTSSKDTNSELNDPCEEKKTLDMMIAVNDIQRCEKPKAPKLSYILKMLGCSASMVEDLEQEHLNEQQPSSGTVLQQASSNPAINISSSLSSNSETKFMTQSSSDNQSSSDLIESSQFSHLGQPSTIHSSSLSRRSQSFYQNLPSLQSSISVQPNNQQKTEERPIFFLPSDDDTGTNTNSSNLPTYVSSRGGNSATFDHTRLPSSPVENSGIHNLLTPADMEIVSSSNISVLGKLDCNGDDLLSPMDFVLQNPTNSATSSLSNTADPSKSKDESSVTVLSKEQLQESLLYLLKNDSSFVSKIHEAYTLSLSAKNSHQKI